MNTLPFVTIDQTPIWPGLISMLPAAAPHCPPFEPMTHDIRQRLYPLDIVKLLVSFRFPSEWRCIFKKKEEK